jgi:hypothetical protein
MTPATRRATTLNRNPPAQTPFKRINVDGIGKNQVISLSQMNFPTASCGVSKMRISICIPLTLTLSHKGRGNNWLPCSKLQGIIKLNKS